MSRAATGVISPVFAISRPSSSSLANAAVAATATVTAITGVADTETEAEMALMPPTPTPQAPVPMAAPRAITFLDQLEREEQKAVQDLRQGVRSLNSETTVYKVLITTVLDDGRPNAPPRSS
jgi:hypothetical protein